MTIETDPNKVSLQTHKFVGMYRPPYDGCAEHALLQCSCGATNFKERRVYDHWLAGHFDVPQWEPLYAPPASEAWELDHPRCVRCTNRFFSPGSGERTCHACQVVLRDGPSVPFATAKDAEACMRDRRDLGTWWCRDGQRIDPARVVYCEGSAKVFASSMGGGGGAAYRAEDEWLQLPLVEIVGEVPDAATREATDKARADAAVAVHRFFAQNPGKDECELPLVVDGQVRSTVRYRRSDVTGSNVLDNAAVLDTSVGLARFGDLADGDWCEYGGRRLVKTEPLSDGRNSVDLRSGRLSFTSGDTRVRKTGPG